MKSRVDHPASLWNVLWNFLQELRDDLTSDPQMGQLLASGFLRGGDASRSGVVLWPGNLEEKLSRHGITPAEADGFGLNRSELGSRAVIPWVTEDGVMICPFNVETGAFERPAGGWVRDVPLLYGRAQSSSDLSVLVFPHAADAVLAQCFGANAIALGSHYPLKEQVKYLADLKRHLIYVGDGSSIQDGGAEQFVRRMLAISDCSVARLEQPLRCWLDDHKSLEQVLDHAKPGLAALLDRVESKRNGKSADERAIELQEIAMIAGERHRHALEMLFRESGCTCTPIQAAALRLVSDLLTCGMPLDYATEHAERRYGVVISLGNAGGALGKAASLAE